MDILHQDSLHVDKKGRSCVLEGLLDAGATVVRVRLAMRRVLPPNISPMGDITNQAGWSALTGQELWVLSSIFPFVVAPIFTDHLTLVANVKGAVISEVALRIGVDPDTAEGKTQVCKAFRSLVKAVSWTSFLVRAPSFTRRGLRVLQKAQRDQVEQFALVMGVVTGIVHKGLHISENIAVHGVVTNCNVGEAKHKEIKASAPSSGERNNPEHIWRATNDSLALKALADGVSWSASGWDGRRWVRQLVEAGPLCQSTLQECFSILPLAPAHSDHGAAPVGRPSGFVDWEVQL
ncbi:unnamed protein product, partial [Pylaiella littoralis]